MPRIQYPRTLVHTPDGFGFIKIRFRYLFCPLPVHAHPPLCWGQLFFFSVGRIRALRTHNRHSPKATASNAAPSRGFASICRIFQFQATQSTGQGRSGLTLPSLYPTSTFPQLLHQPVSASNRFPPHHRQRVEPVPPPFRSRVGHPCQIMTASSFSALVCAWTASTSAHVSQRSDGADQGHPP